MMLRSPSFLILTFIILGIGIVNSSSSNNIFKFVSNGSMLAFAQTVSLTNDGNNNQTQQQQWVDKVNNIRILFSSPVSPYNRFKDSDEI